MADLLCRALEALLRFIECYKYNTRARDQLQNAIALARQCAEARPKSVAAVFMTLDKLLKNWGDKHLVLEIADLCIGAARCAPRTRREVEGEAQALICGRSWVFQRIGRLTEALIEAEKSLQLGKDIGWERDTVYCKKCMGRLYRMMAEQEHDGGGGAMARDAFR